MAIPETIMLKDKTTNNRTIYIFNIKNFNDNYFKIINKNINLKENNFKWIQQYSSDMFEDIYIKKKLDNYKKERKQFSYFKFHNSFIIIS